MTVKQAVSRGREIMSAVTSFVSGLLVLTVFICLFGMVGAGLLLVAIYQVLTMGGKATYTRWKKNWSRFSTGRDYE